MHFYLFDLLVAQLIRAPLEGFVPLVVHVREDLLVKMISAGSVKRIALINISTLLLLSCPSDSGSFKGFCSTNCTCSGGLTCQNGFCRYYLI